MQTHDMTHTVLLGISVHLHAGPRILSWESFFLILPKAANVRAQQSRAVTA